MSSYFSGVQARIQGGRRAAQSFRGVKFSFALHLILGGKLHSCGRDDLFFALQIRFLTL